MRNIVGRELRALNNLISRHIEKECPPNCCDKITASNAWILGYLSENRGREVFGRDLESAFSVTRSTVSKVVEIMEAKGLVKRESVDYDARLKKLTLTPKGEGLIREMDERSKETERLLLAGFSEEEQQQLFSFMHRMRRNLGDTQIEEKEKMK